MFRTEFTLPNDPVFTGPVALDFHSLTGNLGIVHRLLPGLFLDANARQGFRAPNLSDLTKLGESKGQTYEVPNPGLKPEGVFSVDFGVKTGMVRLRAEASVYSAWISDLIASADALYLGSSQIEVNEEIFKVKSKTNTGKAVIRGVELSCSYLIVRGLSVSGTVTGTIGENRTLDEPVGGIPPVFGRIGIRWAPVEPLSTEWYVRFAGRQNRLSSDDKDDPRIPSGGTPGWMTVNGRILWNRKDRVVLEAALENILDENYREHGSGINGPGRNFVFSIQIKT
jgi:outer membrane receptor protein involved in Fe transport